MTLRFDRDVAIVIAAHGDRAGGAPNTLLLGHAQALRAEREFAAVAAGVLKGEPSLEEALAAAAESGARHMAVYPLFMAQGYFTETILPRRIGGAGLAALATLLPPLGQEPALPGLLLARAVDAAARAGWAARDARLLVVGHGSKFDPASAEATRRAAAAMQSGAPFAAVEWAFLEEAPFLDDALVGSSVGSERPTVVAGFFSGDGLHAGEDVPGAIRETGANALYAGSAGTLAEIPALISRAVRARFC